MIIKPYNGDEPYIFISYSHRDKDTVYSVIDRLISDGYRIWYDQGIEPGTEWSQNIADHIYHCEYFFAFISDNYIQSDNCRNELEYARNILARSEKMVTIYIEDTELPRGLAMNLNRIQKLPKYLYPSEDEFHSKLYETPDLDVCLTKPAVLEFTYKPAYKGDTEKNDYYLTRNNTVPVGEKEITVYVPAETDRITITPLEIYYNRDISEGDVLTAHCMIYNGYDHNAEDISVNWLKIKNSDKEIAQTYFEHCLPELKAHEFTVHTFTFYKADKDIIADTADLRNIDIEYFTSCGFEKDNSEIREDTLIRASLTPNPDNQYTAASSSHDQKTDALTLTPVLICFEKDELIADCNIYNGYAYHVNGIRIQGLRIFCSGEPVAEQSFGILEEDIEIPPNEYKKYRFRFDYSSIKKYNAELKEPDLQYYYCCDVVLDKPEETA